MAKTRKKSKVNKKRKSIYSKNKLYNKVDKICLPKIYSMDSI
jgi:hypothetical protein